MASNWDGWDEEDQQTASASSNNNTSSNHNSSGNRNNNSRVNDEPPHRNDDLGEAPELPPIFFTYDPITNKLEVRDRRGNVKAEFSVKTEQGASAYDLWVKGRVDGSDTSYTAYMNDMRGKDGKNGKNAFEEWQDSRDPNTDRSWEAYLKFFTGDKGESAFELWKKVHGEYSNPTIEDFFNYFKGKNGKDAYEVWQDMGFKDRSREDFFKWIASLVETQKGEDGKIYYPHFDGFTLYFTEDIEGKGQRLTEKDIRGKDGRTFEPKFEGTKLHFEDGEGTSTIPVELRGKDAFELWKEYHHKPDAKYEEFEEYFKGQNIQASHSYMDVTNWQCPVQEINTDLIVNSLHTAKTPNAFINDRQKTINCLRDEGNEIKTKKNLFGLIEKKYHTHWGGWFKEFTWWCAGADRSLLRMCPGDHSKYTGIGTVILFTALMAWFSSFIAIQLVFQNSIVPVILFATFWAAMIFFLDRFITNTMYSDGEVTISKQEFLSGLPRILIAIFLGIVISAPLELKIFDQEVKKNIYDNRKIEVEKQFKKDTTELNRRWIELDNKILDIEVNYKLITGLKKELEKLNGTIKTKENEAANDAKKQQTVNYKYDSDGNPTNSAAVSQSYSDRNKLIQKAKTEAAPDEKSRRDTITQQIQKFEAEYTQIDTFKQRKASISEELYKLENDYEKVHSQDSLLSFADKSGLYSRLNSLHAIAMKEGEEGGYTPLFQSTTSGDWDLWDLILKLILSVICATLFIVLVVKKERNAKKEHPEIAIGLKITIGVILSIVAGCLIGWNYELFHYLIYYLTTPIGLIMLLFILIDISPVLYKMMLADGVYDKYLQQEKALAQEKIRLNNAQMLRTIEKGELKSVSPFIMGDVYEDLLKSASDSKIDRNNLTQDNHIGWAKSDAAYDLDGKIADDNKKVFDTVLDFKKRIVLASYAAWYRDMRDAMIGKKDDEEGNCIRPEIILEDTTDNSQEPDSKE